MMKRKVVTLCAALALALTACGGQTTTQATTASTTAASAVETLTGTAEGFGGEVKVTLTMDKDTISKCEIEGDKETDTIGQAAFEELGKQVVAANGFEIDGVSGATVTGEAVKAAVAAALGKEYVKEAAQTTVAETAAPAEIVPIDGGLQMGLAYWAAHGTRAFTEAYAVVQDDTIVAAYLDEFQFTSADADVTPVPNSDSDFGAGFAQGQVLFSKRDNNDYYSTMMTDRGGSTVSLDANYKAIEDFVVGKTIQEVEAISDDDNAVDAVSGATLVDTAGYLKAIVQAAKNAKNTQAVEFDGDSDALKVHVAYEAAHGTRGFTAAAAVTAGDIIVLSYLDEFQFVSSEEDVKGVPNSDSDFAQGYAEGNVLCSKREITDYYSALMTANGGSTVAIDKNFDAIQNHVNGMTIEEAAALAGNADAVDAVSGATLVDTAGYVGAIVDAARK